jgi:hypothetical protein
LSKANPSQLSPVLLTVLFNQYRVRPFPHPDRVEATKWMTEQQLIDCSNEHSTHWVEAGSGGLTKLGKVYLELLGCDDLPNLDSLTLDIRDKTDAFASIVFEDAIVSTGTLWT